MQGRAEHKVPDGKLLRVDVAYEEQIDAVELHGDFFIYPEEALDAIEDAITGIPADADDDRIADAVMDGLPAGTELGGFTPQNVATVVTEAIQDD